MSETVYFLDDEQKLLKAVKEKEIISCIQTKELTPKKTDLMNDKLEVATLDIKKIRDAVFMAVRENGSSFSMYKILNDSDPRGQLQFTGINFAVDELDAYIVKDMRPNGITIKQVAEQILSYTNGEWRVGYTDPALKAISGTFYYVSVKEALKKLQTFNCEIVFKCTIDGNKIADKWIEIYTRIGEVTNKRFVYGSTALEVVRQRDRSQVYTSIIGRGKGEEVGDGYGRRIEFTDVEWKKTNGDPLDKPKGQNWLEYPEMTALYGIPMKNGSKRKRETVLILEDVEDPNELLQATYDNLVEYSRPLVQFKTSVLGGDSIGNTVTIHRSDKNYHYQTRVFKVNLDRLTGKTECGLGDNLSNSSTRQSVNAQSSIADLKESKMTFYESTEIGKYQDDIMRGAGSNGGSVYQVNGIEAGVSNSREVYETVYMDGPNIPNSQHFMIENSLGISFKSCTKGQWQTVQDIHNGPSDTAWTLDGVFNANFIKTGVLEGIDIHSKNENYDIYQHNGVMDFIDEVKKKKIGSVQANALRIANEDGTEAGLNIIQNEPYPLNFIVQRDNGSNERVVFIVPSGQDGKPILNIMAKTQIRNTLSVDELFVNGVKIDTNGGNSGGNDNGWNGQYPPEITTERDKRYWQIWAMALGAGFSKQAAASLLGNAQGESDANPTADEGNGTAGFGYGVWQWTDGTGASSGRAYMITLMTRANITDDPDTITAQFKLLMWHAPNGQWIATGAYPYSWTQFMNLTDIATATRAFEENFERPLNDHPERIGWANDWYAKFKDLEIPKSKGYVIPIAAPITVTSEFGWRTSPINGAQEFHNAIDLVNGNPNTPIYASADGEVVTAGSAQYYDWYGNYTVIKHSDGMYTGYAHQSRVDVSAGAGVTQGQQIGLMGTTGPSTGEHLHFQFMDEFYPSSSAHFHNPRNYIDF